MKKSIVLGAAALATVAIAPSFSDAGEVKIGGYYMFRVQSADRTIAADVAGTDDTQQWQQRLQLNMDMKASEKSHVHLVTRVIDGETVEGSNNGGVTAGAAGADWKVKQAWAETEAFGIGLKVGKMPISLNDDILVGQDTTSFGTILLSKTFGDVTVIGADVRVAEGAATDSDDDVDLYAVSALGKAGNLNYQITGAFLDAEDALAVGNNNWLAATVDTEMGNIGITGTLAYEGGFEDLATDDGDFIAAVRLNAKTGFGAASGYVFYAGENFDAVPGDTLASHDNVAWSPTWDMGGPGALDMLAEWGGQAGAGPLKNAMGVGAGLKVKAGNWTVKPNLDYVTVVEETAGMSESAWGGVIQASTSIQDATTLNLAAGYMDPEEGDAVDVDAMHFMQASIKMKF